MTGPALTEAPLAESFNSVVDLASRWLGGSVMAASDESFGEKENLLSRHRRISRPAPMATAAKSLMAGRQSGGASLVMTGR